MSRIIKFRAWDNKKSEWRNDIVLMSSGCPQVVRSSDEFQKLVDSWYKTKGDVLGGDYAEIDYTDFSGSQYVTISLFTGLKDKAGVDIYEGDIVRYVLESKGAYTDAITQTVTFERGGFRALYPVGEMVYPEVIGNIYETVPA